MSYVTESARQTPVAGQYDVVIAGGGPAGVCAAVAAARRGVKVLLLESAGCLGGIWTNGMVAWVIDAATKPEHALITEIIRNLRGQKMLHGKYSFAFDVEAMKYFLEGWCLTAGVSLNYHTNVCGVVKDGGKITHLITESKSGRECWAAKIFIDCTGDGDLGALAGNPFAVGHPESGKTQPMSLIALLTGIKKEEVLPYTSDGGSWHEVADRFSALLKTADYAPSYQGVALFHLTGDLFYLMANHQYGYSGIDAGSLTAATLAGRREIHRQVDILRSHGGVWQNLQLAATANRIGVREARRLAGVYEVTSRDLECGQRHADGICEVTACVDIHALDDKSHCKIEHSEVKMVNYDIPLRALMSINIDNLLMAGRCVSGDFFAHASYRVTGDAAMLGEAAGVLAAVAAKEQRFPREIEYAKVILEVKK